MATSKRKARNKVALEIVCRLTGGRQESYYSEAPTLTECKAIARMMAVRLQQHKDVLIATVNNTPLEITRN